MNDDTRKKLNGWTVKAILGGLAVALSLWIVALATNGVSSVLARIQETHDGMLTLKSKVEALESAGNAPSMVEHRMMQYIERNELGLQRLDDRVRGIEKEHAEFQRRHPQ